MRIPRHKPLGGDEYSRAMSLQRQRTWWSEFYPPENIHLEPQKRRFGSDDFPFHVGVIF